MSLKEKITEKYGSINKFIETVYQDKKISRQRIYQLLTDQNANPTIETMIEFSRLSEIPLEEIINEYSNRYRNNRTED